MKNAAKSGSAPKGLEILAENTIGRRDCPIADAMTVLGERWTLLVVRELFYGVHRFDQIAGFTGGSRDILADRLRTLEAKGIVERRQYSERPPRFEYHLTESGTELFPVLLAVGQWGTKWATENPRDRVFVHECGHRLDVELVCSTCGKPLSSHEIKPVPVAAADPEVS